MKPNPVCVPRPVEFNSQSGSVGLLLWYQEGTMDRVGTFSSEYCNKLDRAAVWVGTSVVSAFFASLERCSCITLSTTDTEDEEEAKDRPLMFVNSNGESSAPIHGDVEKDSNKMADSMV